MPSKWVKLPTVNASLRMHSTPSRDEHGPYTQDSRHAIKNQVRTQLLTVNASAWVPSTPSRAKHARANSKFLSIGRELTITELLAPGIMQMHYHEHIQFPLGVECALKECLSYTRIHTNKRLLKAKKLMACFTRLWCHGLSSANKLMCLSCWCHCP